MCRLGVVSFIVVTVTMLCADLVWSDPEDVDTWAMSPRGAGWLFGAKVTAEVRSLSGVSSLSVA